MEIEAIVGEARHDPTMVCWQAKGVNCAQGRHRYTGPEYSLTIDVLSLHRQRPGRAWHLLIASELWRFGPVDLRASKWLKLVAGQPQDVLHWIANCRSAEPNPKLGAQEPAP